MCAFVQRHVFLAAHDDEAYRGLSFSGKEEFNQKLTNSLRSAATSPTKDGFDRRMKEVEKLSDLASRKALSYDLKLWAWHTFEFSCMGRSDSNDGESSFAPYADAKRTLAVPQLFKQVVVDVFKRYVA